MSEKELYSQRRSRKW